ncbi:MAG: capsule assembly Wzi family protein [Alloprevotella sp.]
MKKLLLFFLLSGSLSASAQSDLSWEVAMQSTNSSGDYTPLWLNANKHGLSSLDKNNGYLMGGVKKSMQADSLKRWSYGFGASLAATYNFTSPVVVQEAYAEGRWLKGVLTVGSKEWPMELKDNALSSGSQTFGINARPVPQVRIALPDYWTFAGGWLGIKGHIAYGMTTDDGWQKDFTDKQSKYTQDALYHSKAGYLRIGNAEKTRFSLELGLETASLFGGTSYRKWENGQLVGVKNGTGLSSFWNAFVGGGSDVGEDVYKNVEGDILGSWVARLSYDAPTWNLGVYADHFFEDHSAMFLLSYNGYGVGEEWQVKKDNRFYLYDLKDIMLGAELTLKNCPWVRKIVLEYLYTKYQSGSLYHDHTANIPDHLCGVDNYYNHSIFTGWQHWGQVMGNPLYTSPLYNTDGTIQVKNNRFVAWHGGVSGSLSRALDYRLLATYQKGWGSYGNMFPHPRRNASLMAEATYSIPKSGWQVAAAAAFDKGSLLGDNVGLQLTVVKKGVFK